MESSRSKDSAVPSFDGTAERFPIYKEEALQYTFTLERHKRYLAGPRLVQGLSGVARTVVRKRLAVDPQWLAQPRGAYDLLDHLEANLGQPTLLSASQYIHKFFYQLRRKKGETMVQWTNRHSEALWEASRALKRVCKDQGISGTTEGSWSQTNRDRGWGRETYPDAYSTYPSTSGGDEPFDEGGRLREDEDEEGEWPRREWTSSEWSAWHRGSWRSEEFAPPPSWEAEVPDFLPDHLTGFLLLQRSSLDYAERANVLAAIRGQFSVAAVERALKEQWHDDDLMKRDKMNFQANAAWEDGEDEEAFHTDVPSPDLSGDPEAFDAYMADQEIVEEALEVIREKKRTLKEARWRQSQVRMGRKFYPVPKDRSSGHHGHPSSSMYRSRQDQQTKCLRCGGPHRTDNCPQPRKQQANITEEAEIAFGAEQMALATQASEAGLAANMVDNIKAGKGVLDCGATATLGSVQALEAVMTQNLQKFGSDRIDIDPQTTPTFRFGNNGTQACVSTAHLKMNYGSKLGDLAVHVHEVPNQPVLISVRTLKKLGAVVDFGTNQVIYRKLCPMSVVGLEEADNGHLLMPLTSDLLDGAVKRVSPFQGLDHE